MFLEIETEVYNLGRYHGFGMKKEEDLPYWSLYLIAREQLAVGRITTNHITVFKGCRENVEKLYNKAKDICKA